MLTTVIPTFIRDEGDLRRLQRTISSVACQSELPTNVVISDDTKNPKFTREIQNIIEHYDLNISFFLNEGASNASRNTNFAVSKVLTRYLHILHQDDWIIDSNHYLKTLQALETGEKKWSLAKGITDGLINNPTFSPGLTFGFNSIGGPSALVIQKSHWIDLDGEFLLLPDVIQFQALYDAWGAPYISEIPSIEYGTGDHKMTHRISSEDIKNDIQRLLFMNPYKKIPLRTFLTNKGYWGEYLEEISLVMYKSKIASVQIKLKSLLLFCAMRSYNLLLRVKTTFSAKSISRKRIHL